MRITSSHSTGSKARLIAHHDMVRACSAAGYQNLRGTLSGYGAATWWPRTPCFAAKCRHTYRHCLQKCQIGDLSCGRIAWLDGDHVGHLAPCCCTPWQLRFEDQEISTLNRCVPVSPCSSCAMPAAAPRGQAEVSRPLGLCTAACTNRFWLNIRPEMDRLATCTATERCC